MTKHTTRDEIWHEALTFARELDEDTESYQTKFSTDELADRLEGEPSKRTLRDTLNTMVDLGHLEEAWGQGNYELPNEVPGRT